MKVEMSEVRVELVQEEVRKMNPVERTAGRQRKKGRLVQLHRQNRALGKSQVE